MVLLLVLTFVSSLFFLKRCTNRPWWPPLCRFAGWSFILAKLVLISLVVVVLVQSSSGKDPSWKVLSYSFSEWADRSSISEEAFVAIISVALVLLLWAQVFVGKVLLTIANKYEKLNREQQTEKTGDCESTRHLSVSEESLGNLYRKQSPKLSSASYTGTASSGDSSYAGKGGEIVAEEAAFFEPGELSA